MATILIVEDEPQIVSFMSKGLRRAGYQIQIAADGLQAMSIVTSGEIDLMLLDLGLPILDGISVLSAARAQGIQIPVIVVTARAGDDEREKSLAMGANDYITKPFRFSDLLNCVRSYI